MRNIKNGAIYYAGKYKVENIPLRLNLYNDEFEYKEKGVAMSFANPERIDKIVIANETFIYLKESDHTKVSGFVKQLNEELPSVISKMKTVFFPKRRSKTICGPKT